MNAIAKFGAVGRLEAMAQDFLPHGTAVRLLDLRGKVPKALPGEQAVVRHAAAKRQHEFAGGRGAARKAMSALGLTPREIPQQTDRSPKWPTGVVGSISHCDTACISVVAQASGMVTIGIDIEEATPLDEDLVDLICLPREIEWLNQQQAQKRLLLAKLIFSAKEAAYKCQYPLSRILFGFEGFHIKLNLSRETFTATFQTPALPFGPGNKLIGRYMIESGFILSAVWIKAVDPSFEKSA